MNDMQFTKAAESENEAHAAALSKSQPTGLKRYRDDRIVSKRKEMPHHPNEC